MIFITELQNKILELDKLFALYAFVFKFHTLHVRI